MHSTRQLPDRSPSAQAVGDIISDICERPGIGNQWELIDKDVRSEIIIIWTDLIKLATDPHFPKNRANSISLGIRDFFLEGFDQENEWHDDFTREQFHSGNKAKFAVLLIITDISDRRGLKQEYDALIEDDSTRREMFNSWVEKITARLGV